MSDSTRIQHLRDAFPRAGLFLDKEWRTSPRAFALPRDIVQIIERLGPALRSFQRACNALYFHGGDLSWVQRLLDQGKPRDIIDLGQHPRWHDALPSVIRPDLVLTETGVCISELDSLPGGIGLTAWLNETYASIGDDVIGGATGMIDAFAAAFPTEDVLISRESGDYEPEMQWLMAKLGRRVWRTWDNTPEQCDAKALYRFFELFDLANVEHSRDWLTRATAGEIHFTPPLKAFLEEKLWLALFWTPQLESWWRKSLSPDHFDLLRQCIPQGWVLDPVRLPAFAVWHGLNVHSWDEVKRFGLRARELVLKVSGFSPDGWGSRSVSIGHDLSQPDWAADIDEALARYPQNPFVLQRFHRARLVHHPMWSDTSKLALDMTSRVRLCPYYFIPQHEETPTLGGVLATVCPADKKILHGMKDAMMLPCVAK